MRTSNPEQIQTRSGFDMTTDDDPTKTMTINDPVELDYTEIDAPTPTAEEKICILLLAEAKRRAGISKQFQEKITTAKTKPKKDYYKKKLKKNNDILGDVLIRLE
jgi:hypothetical protein